jgi:hypothetical protein
MRMDPISLIVTAVAAGAIVGVRDTASQAVKDAYAGLKSLMRRRFAGNPEAEAALDRAEHQPGADQIRDQLAQQLRAAGAGDDVELITAAQAVLRHADQAGTRAGKYDVRITGGKGIVVGDAANVTMTFNDSD